MITVIIQQFLFTSLCEHKVNLLNYSGSKIVDDIYDSNTNTLVTEFLKSRLIEFLPCVICTAKIHLK